MELFQSDCNVRNTPPFKRQVKRWKWSKGETLWSCEGDLVTHWNSYKTKVGFNHHTTKNIQGSVNIAFLECEYEIYQKKRTNHLPFSRHQPLATSPVMFSCCYMFVPFQKIQIFTPWLTTLPRCIVQRLQLQFALHNGHQLLGGF